MTPKNLEVNNYFPTNIVPPEQQHLHILQTSHPSCEGHAYGCAAARRRSTSTRALVCSRIAATRGVGGSRVGNPPVRTLLLSCGALSDSILERRMLPTRWLSLLTFGVADLPPDVSCSFETSPPFNSNASPSCAFNVPPSLASASSSSPSSSSPFLLPTDLSL